MRSLQAVLVAVFCLMCSDVALAITSNCPSLQNQQNKQLPAVGAMNGSTYLCNNSNEATDPPKLGDLSAQGQMMNMQVCDANCTYHPLFPEDPDSPMIPVKCYSGKTLDQPYSVNGNASAMANNQGPPAPYMGSGGNCEPLMIPQAPINIENQPPPTVKQTKPKPAASGSPAPSPSPSPH
jgi:hypothetical protein